MNIGKAAKLSNLTVKTVRYYANIGLVKPEQNVSSGYREYTDEEVAKLKFIGKARKFDFSIHECKELLSLYEDKNRTSKEVKKITLEKTQLVQVRFILNVGKKISNWFYVAIQTILKEISRGIASPIWKPLQFNLFLTFKVNSCFFLKKN